MDELTSVESTSALPDTPLDGGATSQPSATPQQQSPAGSASSEKPRVNLFESDEFRRIQAQYDRNLQAERQRAYEAEQRAHQAAMAQMDDVERANYQAQLAWQEADQYRQYLETQQALQTRWQRINETAQEFGVPVDVIQDAETPADMYKAALAHLKVEATKSIEARAAALRERQDANSVDLGGGAVGDANTQSRLDRFIKTKNSDAYFREVMGEGRKSY